MFYETSWQYENVTYTGLLIYYDDNDAFMRVKYEVDGQYKVAEFSCYGSQFEEDGVSGYLLEGKDAAIVYGDGAYGYSPDHFFFLDEGGYYGNPLQVDDNGLDQPDIENYMTEVDYWTELSTDVFTEDYVYMFFEEDEAAYDVLLSYNAKPNRPNKPSLADYNNHTTDNDYYDYTTDDYEEPYEITSLGYGNGLWGAVMSIGSSYSLQTWTTDPDFPADWIDEKWSDGYSITDVACSDGLWAVSMSQGSGYGYQTWITDYDFPADWIDEKWNKGYEITSVAYGQGVWSIVMTQNSAYNLQTWTTDYTFPADWIDEKWAEGYSITSMGCSDDLWSVVMSKGSGYGYQTWTTDYTFPGDWIEEKWGEGYGITSMTYGDGLWAVAMSENTGYSYQTFITEDYYPEDWIYDNWNGGESVDDTEYYTEEEDYNSYSHNDYTYTTPSGASTLHLIMVSNTLDQSIGMSCEVDKMNSSSQFEIVCEELGIPIKQTFIDGRDFTKDEVTRVVNNLNPASDDIVVFIYSGHGYRFSDQTSTYPRIDLRYSAYQDINESTSYNIAEIYDAIVSKGARLNIVISDCCNSDIGITSREGFASLTSRRQPVGEIEKLEELFLNTDGDMLITSSKPYQTSCGNAIDGGYFLSSFFSALSKETSALTYSTPEWDNIVEVAIENARYKSANSQGCSTQEGVYKSSVK
ncbi:MAG: DUF7477 domain-containing protein [Chitinophagales bacterium]